MTRVSRFPGNRPGEANESGPVQLHRGVDCICELLLFPIETTLHFCTTAVNATSSVSIVFVYWSACVSRRAMHAARTDHVDVSVHCKDVGVDGHGVASTVRTPI